MRQYTTPEQTAKLIELGFEKPKTIVDKYYDFDAEDYKEVNHYSIGELIEMLPTHYDTGTKRFELTIAYSEINEGWIVGGTRYPKDNTYDTELIDTLFDMCVKLKEEGVT